MVCLCGSMPLRNIASSACMTRPRRVVASRARIRRGRSDKGASLRAMANCASMPATGVRSACAACEVNARSLTIRCARRCPNSLMACSMGFSSSLVAKLGNVAGNRGSYNWTCFESSANGSNSRRSCQLNTSAARTPVSTEITIA